MRSVCRISTRRRCQTTWALICLLQEIGTAEATFSSVRMPFKICGGIKAMKVLKVLGGSTD